MLHGLFIVSLISSVVQGIKDAFTPTIPAENWANKELQYQDQMNGMSAKEILKNAERGRYIVTEKYPEPHRNEHGQIMIENCQLWDEDLSKYGAAQAFKWAEQGRYNLEGEALKKEQKRIEMELKELIKLRKK